MKKTVLAFSQISADLKQKIQAEFELLEIDPKQGNIEQQFKALLPKAHGLIGAGRKLDALVLELAQNLEVISSISVGYDNYALDYLNTHNILLTNTPDVLTETTADLGFALLMCTARRVAELDHFTRQGQWQKTIQPEHFGVDIYGKTLGIIGLGNIGAGIARRGHFGFNMNILHHSRSPKPQLEHELSATSCTLETLLKQSDFVSVNVDLNAQTRHLLGQAQFKLMKPSAILINVSRGAVIDEQALVEALQQKQILAAGLDVYEQEPLQQSPLFALSNVITLPHVGSATFDTRQAMSNLAFDNLKKALNHQLPQYSVNPHIWQNN